MNSLDRMFTPDPIRFAGAYLEHVQAVLQRIDPAAVGRFIQALLDARASDATIFFIGNGGSAATASHFANDLALGPHDFHAPFRALSLTDNTAVLTAIGNDFGYEEVFARQLQVHGRRGDLLVAISASGNSPNLLKAIETAERLGIRTFAITAFDGGQLRRMADDAIHVPTELQEYGPAEDAHMVLDHLVGAYLVRAVRLTHVSAHT